MALYFLEYDLHNEKDYSDLYAELKKLKAKKVLISLWCFNKNSETASELLKHFKQFIPPNTRLVVIQASDYATYNTISHP